MEKLCESDCFDILNIAISEQFPCQFKFKKRAKPKDRKSRFGNIGATCN